IRYLPKRDHAVRPDRAEVNDAARAVQPRIRVVYAGCDGSKADVRPIVRNRDLSDGVSLGAVVVPEEKCTLRTLVEAYAYVIYAISHVRGKPVGQHLVNHFIAYTPTAGWNGKATANHTCEGARAGRRITADEVDEILIRRARSRRVHIPAHLDLESACGGLFERVDRGRRNGVFG